MQNYFIPKLYLSDYLPDFREKAEALSLPLRRYAKGECLTQPGVINNTAHYICSGVLHLSLAHGSGNQKSLTFFGPGTIFPLGVEPHENLIDYELILRAITDVAVYSMSYPQLRSLCSADGEFAAKLLAENCDFIGYLFYQEMNHAYAPAFVRVCDILYLYLQTVGDRLRSVPLYQADLASLAGISRPQLERILKELRDAGVLQTARGRLEVLDLPGLVARCSDDLRQHPIP